MKLQRYDKAFIKDYGETPEGYLTVQVPITRPGVFPYKRADGTVQMEAKLPEEIFSDRTICSARSKPVTDEHPNEPVTIDNYQAYAKGMSHTDARVDDLKLYISMTITDKDLIQKVYDGKKEISIGFTSDVVAESGTYQGQNYEYVQRNIEINHIAVVENGRAGPEVAIRADSDAWQLDDTGGNVKMAKIKVKGTEYEVDDAIKAYIDELVAAKKEQKGDSVDALVGRLDAMEAQLEAKQAELEEAKRNTFSEDEMNAKVAARIELVDAAKPLLGDSFDFMGKTDRTIKEAVIATAKQDFKGDGKSDDYINAFFDATVERVNANGFSSTGSNSMITVDSAGTNKDMETMRAQRLNMRD